MCKTFLFSRKKNGIEIITLDEYFLAKIVFKIILYRIQNILIQKILDQKRWTKEKAKNTTTQS